MKVGCRDADFVLWQVGADFEEATEHIWVRACDNVREGKLLGVTRGTIRTITTYETWTWMRMWKNESELCYRSTWE